MERLNLQLFADDDQQDADSGADDTRDATGGEDSDSKGKTFTQEELQAIAARESQKGGRKALQSLAEELGFDSVDAMKQAAQKARELEDQQKTELQKLQEQAQQAEQQRQQALQTANERLIQAEVKAQASALGFVNGDVAYKLMDRSSVEVDDNGNVTGVQEALSSLMEQHPFLKAGRSAGKSGEDFSGNDRGTTLTMEQIKAMSPDQINERWDDVQKVLESQRR